MGSQLERIIEVSRMPNVSMRILPLEGSHLVLTGAFTYIRFPRIHEVPLRDIATFEHLTGTEYVEAEDDVNKYYVAFQSLEESSLAPDESRDYIAAISREMWD